MYKVIKDLPGYKVGDKINIISCQYILDGEEDKQFFLGDLIIMGYLKKINEGK